MSTWQTNEANDAFPDESKASKIEGPQPAHSPQQAQELPLEDYRAFLAYPMTTLELLLSFPRLGDDFDFERDPDCGREIDFGG